MKYIDYDNTKCAFKSFFVRLSACEIELYESILDFIINHCDNNFIMKNFSESRVEEIEGMRNSIRYVILKYFDKDDLPDRAKEWNYDLCEQDADY